MKHAQSCVVIGNNTRLAAKQAWLQVLAKVQDPIVILVSRSARILCFLMPLLHYPIIPQFIVHRRIPRTYFLSVVPFSLLFLFVVFW